MLTKCPECDLQVSDKALSCPHCGYPFREENKPRLKKNKKKRMRLPNGFGQISEIKGKNLRKPFRAMVTVAKSETGRPICKPLKPEAYFETYNEAYAALVEYNRNPHDLAASMTMNELFNKWFDSFAKEHEYSKHAQSTMSVWRYCESIHNVSVSEIRARHIKSCIEQENITPSTKRRLKTMFNVMLDYAVEYELMDKNYARNFNVSSTRKEVESSRKEHIAFSQEEMDKLWENINVPFVDMLLIQCYSGWRPQELCYLELENVDMENWRFIGGMKTEAGIDRVVPIHSKIRELVRKRYDEANSIGSRYLFNIVTNKDIKELDYYRYRSGFKKIVKSLELDQNHRPHDGRKQFVTMAKKYKVDEYAIKYLVGHSITDLTERVYTQRDFSWLQEEIEKIK